MPALKNQKHEAFAQAVALNMPQSQAYAEHVSGGKCSERTAEVNGSTLAASTEVALRITELRKSITERVNKKFGLTRDKWLDRLEHLSDKAEEAEDYSASIKAMAELGKASAWYEPEKHQLEVTVTLGGNTED